MKTEDKKEEAGAKTKSIGRQRRPYVEPAGLHNGFYAKVWKEPDCRRQFA